MLQAPWKTERQIGHVKSSFSSIVTQVCADWFGREREAMRLSECGRGTVLTFAHSFNRSLAQQLQQMAAQLSLFRELRGFLVGLDTDIEALRTCLQSTRVS